MYSPRDKLVSFAAESRLSRSVSRLKVLRDHAYEGGEGD